MVRASDNMIVELTLWFPCLSVIHQAETLQRSNCVEYVSHLLLCRIVRDVTNEHCAARRQWWRRVVRHRINERRATIAAHKTDERVRE